MPFARRQDLKVEPKSLIDLVRGMKDLLERSVGSQIELRIDLPETLPLALVDANQIEPPAGSYVRLTVSDPGQGMDAVTLEKATVELRELVPPAATKRMPV